MRQARGDMWTFAAIGGGTDAICITTNGFVKKNGACVMGRGCALEATHKFPGIEFRLGAMIKAHGNVVQVCDAGPPAIVAFPTKPTSLRITNVEEQIVRAQQRGMLAGQNAPGWMCKADALLIERSCQQLVALADVANWWRIVLPRPGCGAGELTWEGHVQTILESWLDDRFIVMSY